MNIIELLIFLKYYLNDIKKPYSLFLAHSAFRFFKLALKMLGKISSQFAHVENESCLP